MPLELARFINWILHIDRGERDAFFLIENGIFQFEMTTDDSHSMLLTVRLSGDFLSVATWTLSLALVKLD